MAITYRGKEFYNIGPWCPFHKHLKCLTYSFSKISKYILKTLLGIMHSVDGTAYFAAAVSYECKMFMKLTNSVIFKGLLML